MATPRKKLTPGDVLAIKSGGKIIYLQYIGLHPEYGAAVIISGKMHDSPVPVTDNIFSHGYVGFYPAAAAVAHGLVDVVGHLPPPNVPLRVRRPGARSGQQVNTWIVEGGTKEYVKTTLSAEELELPIAAIWNHEFLIQRVSEGWDPKREEPEYE